MRDPRSEVIREPGVKAPYTTVAVQDATLVTGRYYDEIDAEMAQLEAPTVRDAIEAMRRKGNRPFFEYPWNGKSLSLNAKQIEDPFRGQPAPIHEIAHIFGRVAHTPQQEQFGIPFDFGLLTGMGIVKVPFDQMQVYFDAKEERIAYYKTMSKAYQAHAVDTASERNWAVNFAAGVYLREKIDCFRAKRAELGSYQQQRDFCKAYATRDHEPDQNPEFGYQGEDILDAPYDLIKLTPAEWKSIEAVATNLMSPRDTPYPGRLTAVLEALLATCEYYNAKPVFERMVQDQANHHPKGEAFDPVRFHAARAKRGAATERF